MKKILQLIVFLAMFCAPAIAQNFPPTSFPLTENPISQNGQWLNGSAASALWGNVQTNGSMAYGVSLPSAFGDPSAVLTGSWGVEQYARGIVKINTQPSSAGHEVELRLRTTITTNSVSGYEVNCSVASGSFYIQIVRWNGPNGNFTQLDQNTPASECVNGDVLEARVTGPASATVIRVWRNGIPVVFSNCSCTSVVDTSGIASGSPGMGFFDNQDSNWNFFGFSSYTASALLSSGIISANRSINWTAAGLPAIFPDGETTLNPWTPPVRTTICATVAPEGTSGSPIAPTNILNAMASCPAGEVVLLSPAGSYYYTGSVFPGNQNNVTLRGLGADKTKFFFPSSGGVNYENQSGGSHSATWSAGYAQGSTTITLSANPGTNQVITLQQCDTGFSGASCTTGGFLDNGAEWVCTANVNYCANQGTGSGGNSQIQNVFVTKVTGSGPFTVTITPGLYLDNWASGNTPVASWYTSAIGDGVEDMSVDTTGGGGNIFLGYSYASWLKGVRIISGSNSQVLGLSNSENCLIMNNYLIGSVLTTTAGAIPLDTNTTSDNLILNNLEGWSINGAGEEDGAGTGDVWLYNYNRDMYTTSGNPAFLEPFVNAHHAGTSFMLFEGNDGGNAAEDAIHGTHFFHVDFRDHYRADDAPYTRTQAIYSVDYEDFARFNSIIGSVLGSTVTTTCYQTTPTTTCSNPVYVLGLRNGFTPPSGLIDSLVAATTMRWGNYDTITGANRFCGAGAPGFASAPCSSVSEVPSSLNVATGFQQTLSGSGTGPYTATLSHTPCILGNNTVTDGTTFAYDNGSGTFVGTGIASGTVNCTTGAVTVTFSGTPGTVHINYLQQTSTPSPYLNAVPASTVLPASFYFPIAAHPSGGTGLSFWKVCTNYPTCSTFQTQPFPTSGPDITGGDLTAGHSYSVPAAVAWQNLPIDTAYQTSYTITNSSWAGGTETLAVSSLPGGLAPVGEFQVSGQTPSGCNGTFVMSASTTTTVSYAAASNLGCSNNGSFKFPDIRQFNETIYQTDSSSIPVIPSGPVGKMFTAVPLPVGKAPTISSLSPKQTYVASKGFSQNGLTWASSVVFQIKGTNLINGSTVTFDTKPLTASFVSSSEIDAILPQSMVSLPSSSPISHTITVTVPSSTPVLN